MEFLSFSQRRKKQMKAYRIKERQISRQIRKQEAHKKSMEERRIALMNDPLLPWKELWQIVKKVAMNLWDWLTSVYSGLMDSLGISVYFDDIKKQDKEVEQYQVDIKSKKYVSYIPGKLLEYCIKQKHEHDLFNKWASAITENYGYEHYYGCMSGG